MNEMAEAKGSCRRGSPKNLQREPIAGVFRERIARSFTRPLLACPGSIAATSERHAEHPEPRLAEPLGCGVLAAVHPSAGQQDAGDRGALHMARGRPGKGICWAHKYSNLGPAD
jgi:hypothetical protein